MAKGKFYCTFKWRLMHGYRSRTIAIECVSFEQARDVAMDIYSINGTMFVNINKCGRLPKNTVTISYEDYKKGVYLDLE